MIHWLLQSVPIEMSVERILNSAEYAVFERPTNAKRQQDWLLGRWTAKNLVQRVIINGGGPSFPLTAITVRNDDTGAPMVDVPGYPDLSLSISHSHGRALCAVVEAPNWPLGADLELIEPRSPHFFADFFNAEERLLVEMVQPERRDMLVTAIWSAKESVLKALHIGLRVDTRAAICLIDADQYAESVWIPFEVDTDRRQLGRDMPPLSGWWRVEGRFVLTLVCRTYQAT